MELCGMDIENSCGWTFARVPDYAFGEHNGGEWRFECVPCRAQFAHSVLAYPKTYAEAEGFEGWVGMRGVPIIKIADGPASSANGVVWPNCQSASCNSSASIRTARRAWCART